MKGNIYPFTVRAKDPTMENLLNILKKDRTVTVSTNKFWIKKLSYKIKPIRKDIFIGFDRKTYDSNISIKNPFIKIDKNGKDFIFRF